MRPLLREAVRRRAGRASATPDAHNSVEIPLSDEERQLPRAGQPSGGGPAHTTDEFAVAMGFKGTDDLLSQRHRLSQALAAGEPLSRLDWRRMLLATELAFASDVVDSGVEWPTTTGFSDVDAIELLRGVQRKVARRSV